MGLEVRKARKGSLCLRSCLMKFLLICRCYAAVYHLRGDVLGLLDLDLKTCVERRQSAEQSQEPRTPNGFDRLAAASECIAREHTHCGL
jgi:hypothetical protein